MRNLKKFLALVLALMMAFSLMVTVNAANADPMSDLEDVTEELQEAVTVLNGMGIITGFENGEFRPQDTIRRVDVSALVYRLVTGDWEDSRSNLYSTYQKFSDVTSSYSWAAGYIGYCANQEIIKGVGGNRYAPESNVTGYQILAMVLRAVGYDQKGEFEGTDWQVRVASTATQLGILDNINSTSYAGTLGDPATRELVAEIIFRAAQLPTVRYELGYYNPYVGVASGQGSNILNASLGYMYYGLANTKGIVLGNQATGEDDETVIGIAGSTTYVDNDSGSAGETLTASWNRYQYPGTTVIAAGDAWVNGAASTSAIVVPRFTIDEETGLDLFGHEVNVWYNAKGSNPHTTYYLENTSTLSAVVSADKTTETIDKSNADGAADGKIAQAAADAGFTIPATGNAPAFYESASFSRLSSVNANTAPTAGTFDSKVWVLISNNNKKTVDVVISVDVVAAQITKVDNYSATKQIGLDVQYSTGKLAIGTAAVFDQDDITSPASDFVIGNKVIVTAIKDSTATNTNDGTNRLLWLDVVPEPSKTGTVVSYDQSTGVITLSGGEKLKPTIIDPANAVENTTNNYNVAGFGSAVFANAPYKFTLDMQGNWLHAERVYDDSFIYGTYIDYSTVPGSSTFTYTMVGVNLNGDVITTNPTKYNLAGTEYELNGNTGGDHDIGDVGIPFHDRSTSTGLNGRNPDGSATYKGFISTGELVDGQADSLYEIAGIQSLAGSEITASKLNGSDEDYAANSNGTTIDEDGINMSVVAVDVTGNVADLYLTEKTKFIVVDGYGTDSLKPVVYNGISGLLGGSSSVDIDTDTFKDEILFTMSPYVYSAVGVTSYQVETMILPENALEYNNGSNLYFIDNVSASTVTDVSSTAVLRTVYKDGEKIEVWIDSTGNTNITGGSANTFWYLKDTGKKAADGQVIYTATSASSDDAAPGAGKVCWSGTSGAGVSYAATTNNGRTATIGGSDLVNITGAKVINLKPDLATIESMDDLNYLSSVKTVTVCVVYSDIGSTTLAYIYVINVA